MNDAEQVPAQTEQVRKGLFRLVGILHTRPSFTGGRVCGGQVFAELFKGSMDEDVRLRDSWECFCEACGHCDANGWDTLAECVKEAQGYWCEEVI